MSASSGECGVSFCGGYAEGKIEVAGDWLMREGDGLGWWELPVLWFRC